MHTFRIGDDFLPSQMTKSELRKMYLARQRAFSQAERTAQSRNIADNFFKHFDLSSVNVLHTFIPIAKFNEIDTTLILYSVWKNTPQIRTVVPRVNFETGEIESLTYAPETELFANAWEIHEPQHDDTIEAEEIDMVIVPLLCFDLRGHRVGYGKGFYDRFLKSCREDCVRVGLSYFGPVDMIDDVHEGDITLDHCILPGRAIRILER